jgi:arginine-tRNA-protein transferase
VRELQLIPNIPPEVVVLDDEETCTYLPEKTARQPLRMPIRFLSRKELDARLEAGDRRYGRFLYNQKCPSCRACEAIRVDVAKFQPSRTQRRVKSKGDAIFRMEVGPVVCDDERVALFSKHETERGLRRRSEAISAEGYARFLVDSCVQGFEMRYAVDGHLVGVAIVDRGEDALSAVYTYYDPTLNKASPGVYSILAQIELCRQWGLRWLYLGLYVGACKELAYKADYIPHERRVDGAWTRFEKRR